MEKGVSTKVTRHPVGHSAKAVIGNCTEKISCNVEIIAIDSIRNRGVKAGRISCTTECMYVWLSLMALDGDWQTGTSGVNWHGDIRVVTTVLHSFRLYQLSSVGIFSKGECAHGLTELWGKLTWIWTSTAHYGCYAVHVECVCVEGPEHTWPFKTNTLDYL